MSKVMTPVEAWNEFKTKMCARHYMGGHFRAFDEFVNGHPPAAEKPTKKQVPVDRGGNPLKKED